MGDINLSILPVIKTAWQSQLNALRSANENAKNTVTDIQRQMGRNSTLTLTLKPQLEQAQLAQWQAVQQYNSFIESGSQLLKVAGDADNRLKSSNLSLFERDQLESTRDSMVNLASEFITFKTQNGATLQYLQKMDIGAKSYYSDGSVQWNPLTRDGYLGQLWDDTKEVGGVIKEALLQGPFTKEENYQICQSALSALPPALAGKILVQASTAFAFR